MGRLRSPTQLLQVDFSVDSPVVAVVAIVFIAATIIVVVVRVGVVGMVVVVVVVVGGGGGGGVIAVVEDSVTRIDRVIAPVIRRVALGSTGAG
jgi:hypothetical protein